jgi:hypothetical protein
MEFLDRCSGMIQVVGGDDVFTEFAVPGGAGRAA